MQNLLMFLIAFSGGVIGGLSVLLGKYIYYKIKPVKKWDPKITLTNGEFEILWPRVELIEKRAV